MLNHFIYNLRVLTSLISVVSAFGQAQSFEAEHLELKQKQFQQLIRTYQDSLADVDYLLAALHDGDIQEPDNFLDYSKPSIKGSKTVPVQNNPKLGYEQNRITKSTLSIKADADEARQIEFYTTKKKSLTSKFDSSNNANSRQQSKPRIVKNYGTRRVGAICRDGTRSSATGRGACSHHRGVSYWLVE